MSDLTDTFNTQAKIHALALWCIMILMELDEKEAKRKARNRRLSRAFNEAAMKEARIRYYLERGIRP